MLIFLFALFSLDGIFSGVRERDNCRFHQLPNPRFGFGRELFQITTNAVEFDTSCVFLLIAKKIGVNRAKVFKNIEDQIKELAGKKAALKEKTAQKLKEAKESKSSELKALNILERKIRSNAQKEKMIMPKFPPELL